jgi:hypothetical protein
LAHHGFKPNPRERSTHAHKTVTFEHASGIPEVEHEQVRGSRSRLHAEQDATKLLDHVVSRD